MTSVKNADDYTALTQLFAVAVAVSSGTDGIIDVANPLLCELTGYTAEELVGQPLDILIPSRSREAHKHYRAGYMLHPKARPMGPDREVVILHKSGQEIRVWIGLAPLGDDSTTAVILPMDIGRSYGLTNSTKGT